MVVTEGDDVDDPNMHTLDASRSSALASAVRPEVKLKAILEIARNLSSELKIDTVAPKILDSLVELFPQAERLFLMLLDPSTKRLVRKAFKYRPSRRTPFGGAVPDDEVPMSISRSIVNHVLGQKKAVLSQDAGNDKNLPTSASIADLKIRSVMCVPLLTPDSQAAGHPPARHQRPQAVPPGRPRRPGGRRQPGGHRHPERGDARVAAGTRAARARPEARRAGAEAVPAAVGAQRSPASSSSPTTTRPTRSAATTTTSSRFPQSRLGDRAGRRLGQGGRGGPDDGQVLGRHPLLHPHRGLAGRGRQRAQQPALRRRDRREVHHAEPQRPRPRARAGSRSAPPATFRCSSAAPTGRSRSWARTSPASRWGSCPTRDYQQAEIDSQPGRRGRHLLRRRDRRPEHPRGALRLTRQPPPAEAAGRIARAARGRRPVDPPGHPRVLDRARPGRRHHPDLLRTVRSDRDRVGFQRCRCP